MSAVVAGLQVLQGFQKSKADKVEAGNLNRQADIAVAEGTRDASGVAQRASKFLAQQRVDYLKNGVTLDGSPLLVQQEGYSLAQQEADAAYRSGLAKGGLYRQKAKQYTNQARSDIFSGIFSAVGTGAQQAEYSGAFE